MRRDLLVPTLCALTVEVIRRCWERGLYRDNKWLRLTYDNWFHHWVDWKTRLVMDDVDAQVIDLLAQWDDLEDDEVVSYSELVRGETALGGPMQLSHRKVGRMDELTDNE